MSDFPIASPVPSQADAADPHAAERAARRREMELRRIAAEKAREAIEAAKCEAEQAAREIEERRRQARTEARRRAEERRRQDARRVKRTLAASGRRRRWSATIGFGIAAGLAGYLIVSGTIDPATVWQRLDGLQRQVAEEITTGEVRVLPAARDPVHRSRPGSTTRAQ